MSQKLVQTRDKLKASIQKILTFGSKPPADATLAQVEAKLIRLHKIWDQVHEVEIDLELLTGETEIEYVNIEFDSIEELYDVAVTRLSNLIARLTPKVVSNVQSTSANASRESVVRVVENRRELEAKLPGIGLPRFNGHYENWTSFRDLFTALVGNNDNVTNAVKLYYLKSSVENDAEQLLRSYELTDANYEIAWNALQNQYENKRLIVNAHFKKLFGQKMVNVESATGLRCLVDTTMECVRSLRSLELPTDHWDSILVFLVSQKLDIESHKQWELSMNHHNLPTLKQLTDFLELRCRSLEAVDDTALKSIKRRTVEETKSKSNGGRSTHHAATSLGCEICGVESHRICKCPEFIKLDVSQRTKLVRDRQLCYNCLRIGHSSSMCRFDGCKVCNRRHNTLLHYRNNQPDQNKSECSVKPENKQSESHSIQNLYGNKSDNKHILLATACTKIQLCDGTTESVRVLFDSGSQASFITESCVQRLQLKKKTTSIPVSGLGVSAAGYANSYVSFKLISCVYNSLSLDVSALVLKKLTGSLPNHRICVSKVPKFHGITLADPQYYEPGNIDVLIGADVYGEAILNGWISGDGEGPNAQNTIFGWVLFGPIVNNIGISANMSLVALHSTLDADLRYFWQVEEVGAANIETDEEMLCEQHFISTHSRDESGRYVVKLPFKKSSQNLGNSKQIAIKRLFQTEKTLAKNPELQKQYCGFLEEYEALNHMQLANDKIIDANGFYLPHHFVLKESTTTKLRVVFDASCKSSNGISLNDKLLVGSKLQDDIMNILLRFRMHKIGVTADVVKMYRQVLIHKDDRSYQRILWRKPNNNELVEFELNTVTYGMAAAPFLAIRALRQLAVDEAHEFEKASKIVLSDFYVDDMLTGFDDETVAVERVQEIIKLLSKGGFDLSKFASNYKSVLDCVSKDKCEVDPIALKDGHSTSVKTLGLKWFNVTDQIGYTVKVENIEKFTKRSILSSVSKLYDPLGLVSPSIIWAKILIQNLWTLGLGWDDQVPADLVSHWKIFEEKLKLIGQIKVPRWIGTSAGSFQEIHGFCDASEDAYAAVLYLRSTSGFGKVNVELISAKTKVAPIGQVSLPRLELCAAVLLTKLFNYVKKSIPIETSNFIAWSDSQVVLSWLRKLPRTWKTFIANRVAYVQAHTTPENWRHVPSASNPADCASRGIMPDVLISHELWWHGPQWLSKDQENWPVNKHLNLNTNVDQKVNLLASVDIPIWELINKYNSLSRLTLVTCGIMRFVSNCRSQPSNRLNGYFSTREMTKALEYWIRATQQHYFELEIKCCKQKRPIPRKSRLLCLNPYLDENGILRMKGRLSAMSNGSTVFNQIILPNKSKLTNLIISDIHLKLLHGGVQIMLANLRHKYWIIHGRSVSRKIVHECRTCFSHKPRFGAQLMGNLPPERLVPSKPFLKTGVDYAGPIYIKTSHTRNAKTTKTYIALFICFVTKAIHLEAVSDLTTIAFLAAFRRFVSRRGRCSDLYSDNGTNFVGANRELGLQLKQLLNDPNVSRACLLEETNWHFIPPGTPHFGGLWESGVKSVKHHLRRVVGDAKLTLDEMSTTLCQIEACLNSRPLCTQSDDPDDLVALTPGHFLIGEPTVVVPEPDLISTPVGRCNRWQLSQKLMQNFWYQWRKYYMSNLQQRPKWLKQTPNFEVGKLVLIKDERFSPGNWPLGRVCEVHPDSEGIVRIVSVRHRGGITKKYINKLCILPNQ